MQKVASLKDNELFKVNQKLDKLADKRTALAKDRFKQKEAHTNLKSLTERVLVKRMMNKGPSGPKKEEVIDEFANLWATPLDQSKNIKQFRDFIEKSTTKVKAVMTTLPGQSVNPSATAHTEVLKKVVQEEEQEIEKNFKGTIKQHALATVANNESEDS